MRGRWVLTSPLLLIAAMLAPALPLGALMLLGGLALTVLGVVVANSLVRHGRPEIPPCSGSDAEAG